MFSVGRLMDNCQHRSGWESENGEERCTRCGTRRFTDYGALRPPEAPHAVRPSPEDRNPAERAAAIAFWAQGGGAMFDPGS
ncbi:hypothetical protein I5Q34_09015 [Streptomyces sp. AV19]|uniref:DUF6255 family natural product biosynthesis protein n=1 Tax=Streptomyces sp. AV19 TaxID=2793068 RepID=UPI0018FE7AA5|nr:DUF6255 family natural product biosynthesis protein [Streptomyces sp. AV19]MBH1934427.1 hypothetical protein [Streptomyces sp. AV19]MDG4533216.1 DUF6255 family natural product biosynthesis protein [Streptomyces sp. AV19]